MTSIGTLAIALSAFAQGIINLGDTTNLWGVAIGRAGFYYSGTYSMEVWELNASSVPYDILRDQTFGDAPDAYRALAADGFKKEVTFANKTMSQGEFELGQVLLPDVSPAGSTVVLALAVWNNSAPNWYASENARWSGQYGVIAEGVIAFVNPTVAPTSGPPPVIASLPGWSSSAGDLIMEVLAPIPEPTTLSLVALGAAALLLFRHRK